VAQTIVVDNIVELKVYCQQGEQVAVNTYHWKASAITGISRTDEQVAVDFAADVAPLYKAWMPSTALFRGIRVQIIHPLPEPVYQANISTAGIGARGADGLAPQLCGLVTKRTVLAGRANRGRMYLPFFAEDQSSADGRPEAAAMVLMSAWANYASTIRTFTSGPNSVTLRPVLWQRVDRTSIDVNAIVVRDAWATQRRRSLVNKPDNFGPL